jgi:hypothetical protein
VERAKALTALQQMQAQAEAQKVRRPNVDEVCALFARIVELFEAATDEEREQILQALVGRVEMEEKEKGTCEVSLLPQVPVPWLEPTNQMGAGARVITTNPRFYDAPIKVWRGGRNRTKEPRQWPRTHPAGG